MFCPAVLASSLTDPDPLPPSDASLVASAPAQLADALALRRQPATVRAGTDVRALAMTPHDQPRIFISYSTRDGAEAAGRLRQRLEDAGFAIWQDIVALRAGHDWWSQIEATLRAPSVEHLVLVVSESALERPVIRQEVRLARQEGVQVTPMRADASLAFENIPRWLGHILYPARPEHWQVLLNTLAGPSQQKRVAMMAPEPPADFIARPREFDALKAQLLDAKGDAVAITAALRGAGGYGKTTLAKALAHDPHIQDAYFDGILWVELGEKPENLLGIIADLIERMTGARPGFETLNSAASALAEALGDRRILLVVDDVWREQDLRPFLQGGPNTTRLVTTRIDNVLPVDARRQPVDAMSDEEARALLAYGLPEADTRAQAAELRRLAARLGEWAQLLKLVNGFLRDRVVKARQPLAQAVAGVNKRLDDKGLVAFDSRNPEDRTKAVARTIRVSVELLDEAGHARFGELGIFPKDADVPIGIVARLWGETGGLDEVETEDLLIELYGLSLLLGLDLDRRTLRFHDTVRQYLQDEAGAEGLKAQHQRLIRSMGDIGGADDASEAERRYFYLHLPHHLAKAGDRATLDQLLLDPAWLQAKLDATASPQALVADYQEHGQGPMQDIIGRTLRLTTGILARDRRQLQPHLMGRLMACGDKVAPAFLTSARRCVRGPAMLTQRPSLTPPGAEIARLEGHSDSITALAALPDGRLASCSRDKTIRLWDVTSGVEIGRLEGHCKSITALAALPDGRLASGSHDNTIRLWDVTSGVEIARLVGHSKSITALAALPDGRLASGSHDNTIRLWDVESGVEFARFKGDGGSVNALAFLPDDRLASAPNKDTIRLLDLARGAESAYLKGYGSRVTSLAVLSADNGCGLRLASGAVGGHIRVWDVESGAVRVLKGHTDSVEALTVLPDGRLASASHDHTIRLWDVASRCETGRLKGHGSWVTALVILPATDVQGWRLASGSRDNTIRLWDVSAIVETDEPQAHTHAVKALAVLPAVAGEHQVLASGSSDRTIRLWNATSAVETACLKRYGPTVESLTVVSAKDDQDWRLASGSNDSTIRLWDVVSGTETACLGRSVGTDALLADRFSFKALVMLPDGRLASGSSDGTIRLWDVASGAETGCFKSVNSLVRALAVLPAIDSQDWRLAVSLSRDHTIRLLDVVSGIETACLEGHSDWVEALAVLPANDGRGLLLASGSRDNTIRLWDVADGAKTVRLEGHGSWVRALAALPAH